MLDEGGGRAQHPRYLVAAVVTECSAQGKRRRAVFNVGEESSRPVDRLLC